MSEYVTKHVGFAAFLLYVLGDESHISTTRHDNSYAFSFDDPDYRCKQLQPAFFGEEGAATGNARALLDCSRAIGKTITEVKNFGSWARR
jgi:hypothetical protein